MANPTPAAALRFILPALALWLGLARARAVDLERAESGLFRIVNLELNGDVSTGTGFLVNGTGLIVTNCHVVDESRTLLVVQRQPAIIKVWSARLVSVDGAKDLAVIQADGVSGSPFVLNARGATKGSDVYALGFPGQADQRGEFDAFYAALKATHFHDLPISDNYDNFVRSSVKKGNVEDIRPRLWGFPTPQGRVLVVQHSASMTRGNSGGPLIDDEDCVVGVNTSEQGEQALKNAAGERVLMGNILHFSSSSTELTGLLDGLHLAYNTAATPAPTAIPTPTSTPVPTITPASVAAESVRSPTPAASEASEPRETATTPAEPANNRLLWIAGTLFAIALVAGAIFLWRLLRGRAPESPSPLPPPLPRAAAPPIVQQAPVVPPRPPAPRETWVLGGQDLAGHPYRLAFDAQTFARRSGVLLLGRSQSRCDLRIDHESLSRIHAEVHWRNSALSVIDKGSANGTKVNDRVLAPETDEAHLRPGDKLHVGEITLTLGVERPV